MTCQVETLVTVRYDAAMNVEALHELIEHKFALEPLLAVQGLANTYSFEDDEELLPDPKGSRQWLVEAGLLGKKAKVSAKDHDELLELRKAVRALLEANQSNTRDPDGVETLRRMAAEYPVEFEVTDGGKVAIDLEPAASIGELIAQMVGIVGLAQDRDQWHRLKICAADDCRWTFYDTSKNRGGTWCRMEVCGNRTKNRRYRKSQSALRAGSKSAN